LEGVALVEEVGPTIQHRGDEEAQVCLPCTSQKGSADPVHTSSYRALTLSPDKWEQIFFDDALPGLDIRIRAGGKRTWIAQYRIGLQQRRGTIGSVETVDAQVAGEPEERALANQAPIAE
jgi:hypothetical protein